MTLEGDEGHEETPSSALTPGVDGVETGLQEDTESIEQGEPSGQPAESNWQRWYRQLAPLLGYLPTGAHESDTDRDGLLSYAVEWHAAIIGLSVGMAAATTGEMQLVLSLAAIALGVGRVQQQFTETVQSQLVKEPWYAIVSAAVGYVAIHYDLLAQIGISLGV